MPVISLSLAHLGLGVLIAAAIVGVREVGRGFFSLCGWSGALLVLCGWLLRGARVAVPGGAPAGEAGGGGSGDPAWLLAGAASLLALGCWAALRRRRRELAGALSAAAGATAAAAVGLQGWRFAGGPAEGALVAADFLLSAGLLGGVTVAMILGHWYLVQPGLAIEPLARLSGLFILLLIVRAVMEAAATAGAIASGGLSLAPPRGEVLAFPALVLAQRALFGLAGPLLLAPLVHRTVKMRSTMSATGLLYVAVALVWVGEFLSKYLLLPLRLL